MNKIFQFKSSIHVEIIKPNVTFLFSEKENVLLRGELYCSIASFLKEGMHSLDHIAEQLAKTFSLAETYYAILRLEKQGYLEEKNEEISKELSAFCHLQNIPIAKTVEKLKTTKIFIQSLIDICFSSLQTSLKHAGLILTDKEEEATLALIITDDYLHPKLKEFNQKRKKPWVLIKPCGLKVLVGPIFIPNETGCWECLAHRLQLNRLEESYVKQKLKKNSVFPISIATLNSTKNFTLELAAAEIFKWVLKNDHPKLVGKILSYNFAQSQLEEHVLTKRPQCPHCGDPSSFEKQLLEPILLKKRSRSGIKDGGNRQISPEETIEKYSHHISFLSGIVQHLTPIKIEGKQSMHVFGSGHNLAISNLKKGLYPKHCRSYSGGKGKTKIQAKASGLCEALERYSGVFEGFEYRKKSSYLKLKHEAIPPHELLLYSKKQYRERAAWNKIAASIHYIPQEFLEESVIDWTPVWSLKEQRHKFLPSGFCYYDYPDQYFFKGDSNGCAAGNCIEEAILQGFYELVERDAIAIWWYNRIQRPQVDLQSFKDPYIQKLLQDYQLLKRNLWVLDITHDLNIPTFVAVSQKQKASEDLLFGFGSHLNPSIALGRALTEMNQFLSGIQSWKEEVEKDPNNKDIKLITNWLKGAKLEEQTYLKPAPHLPAKTLKDYHFLESDDLLEDIHQCLDIVEASGMEMFVLNQTKPDIGLNVVKVIVPKMRHFWPRFAPGRLYDVPVQLGWLKEKTREEDLNPTAMFL